jgi:Ca-activated chloride channel homolog
MLLPMKVFAALILAGLLAPAALAQTDLPASPSDRFHKPPQAAPSQQQQPAQQQKPQSANDIATPDAAPAPPAPAPNSASKPADAPASASSSTTTAKGDTNDADLPHFTTFANEVNVVFTVTDKHGHFVKDLKRDDFRVLDDQKPVSIVRDFRAETNLPLRVGLLIDASSSIRDRFTFEQEAAVEFLNSIVRPRSDRAFVIGFDTTPEIFADFTDSADKLATGVRHIRPGGGTAIWDAIFYAARDKLMKEKPAGTPIRRAIIVLSDGEDNQSRVTREEAIEMCQRAEVVVYAISTNVSGNKSKGDRYLERLTDATGGRAFFPFKIQDVANAFTEIQDELRSQYLLAYRPEELQANGKYHSIEILAQNHKNLHVRSRRGYFAPKVQ